MVSTFILQPHQMIALLHFFFFLLLKAVLFSSFVVLLVIAILFHSLKQGQWASVPGLLGVLSGVSDSDSLELEDLYVVTGVCMSRDSPLLITDGPECIPTPFLQLIACDVKMPLGPTSGSSQATMGHAKFSSEALD